MLLIIPQFARKRNHSANKKSKDEEVKKPHFAVAQYPLDLKSKWKP